MAIQLSKGKKLKLSKEAPGLKTLYVGLGWDVKDQIANNSQGDFDLDLMIFGTVNGKVRTDRDLCFYGQKELKGVLLSDDNKTGDGDGDDEYCAVTFSDVDSDLNELWIVADIHKEPSNPNNYVFGMVQNASLLMKDADKNEVVASFDLEMDADEGTSLLFARLVKRNDEWIVDPIGDTYNEGLVALCGKFGVNASW